MDKIIELMQSNSDFDGFSSIPYDFEITEKKESQYRYIKTTFDKDTICKFIAENKNITIQSLFLATLFDVLRKQINSNTISIGYLTDHLIPIKYNFNNSNESIIKVCHSLSEIEEDILSNTTKNKIENIFKGIDILFSFEKDFHDIGQKIAVLIYEFSSCYEIFVWYDSNYYMEGTIEFFARHYSTLIQNVCISNIQSTIDEEEMTLIKETFNCNKNNSNNFRSVLEMIEESTLQHENDVAIVFESKYITYADLRNQSNILANTLTKKGVNKGDYVVIIPEKGIEMVIAIIAVLKCGAIYVPIDPSYPVDRINYIIQTCNPKIVLTNNYSVNFGVQTLEVKNVIDNCPRNVSFCNSINVLESDLAYCIFTSGTTGKPKGVKLKHGGLSNLVKSYWNIYNIDNNDTLLQFASIAFDQSVWDIFTILTVGGTLCITPPCYIDSPRQLEQYMVTNKVSVAALTPAYIKLLQPENIPTLKVIESGSAAIEPDVMKKWIKYCRVFNTYGPTESTVNALSYELSNKDIGTIIPIGRPIPNINVYIMDDQGICGINEPGELCIAGIGVADGYLGDEEKTTSHFVDNPYGKGKLYKTGDLAKWRYDGNVIYLGRTDDQIKIRGFRIELGEIEKCLKLNEFVKDAHVMTESTNGEEAQIIAYFIPKGNVNINQLYKYLSEKLPHYMIPADIVPIDSMPLTTNGKINRTALKQIRKKRHKEYVMPRNDVEKNVFEIFKDVLNGDMFGITDNFYNIGVTSIKAIVIASRLRELGYEYTTRDIINAKTIQNLCNQKNNRQTNLLFVNLEDSKYEPVIKQYEKAENSIVIGCSFLTPSQMYMLNAYRNHIIGDNFLQYFYNCTKTIDHSVLNSAIQLLPKKNPALTTAIIDTLDIPVQMRFSKRVIELEIRNIMNSNEMDEICRQDVLRGFDFEKEALIRFKLFEFPNGSQKLLLSISHIIADGWSVELIMQDLSNFYLALLEGTEESLSYNKLLINSESILNECYALINGVEEEDSIKYWEEYFNSNENATSIPYDKCTDETDNDSYVTWIDEAISEKIKEYCKNESISENTFFEFVYASLLALSNNKSQALFYKVVSGRDLPVIEIDSIVGMLINILPQQVNVRDGSISTLLKGLNRKLFLNSQHDKIDFYNKKINGILWMEKAKTFFVFSNYYELVTSIFDYEFDRDQDDVDLSLFVDAMSNKYQILITCKKQYYTHERLVKIADAYINIILGILEGNEIHDIDLRL